MESHYCVYVCREQRGGVPQETMQSMATLDPAQRCAELRHGYAARSPDGDLQASVMMSKFNISQDAQVIGSPQRTLECTVEILFGQNQLT